MKERSYYCITTLMGKLYLIGGYFINEVKYLTSCFTYEIIKNTWNKLADLNVARGFTASTVFEGKIVVTGGLNSYTYLKSVESYDCYENKWTYLPDIIKPRCSHAAVSLGNKMFVIDGYVETICEVFYNFSRKFIKINSEIKI